MGLAKNQIHEKRTTRGKRGSVDNTRRLEAFGNRKPGVGADWGGCDSERMQGVVMRITELGGAIIFGLSRDGGAHSITLMLDGERETLWFNGDADLDVELGEVSAKLDAMS